MKKALNVIRPALPVVSPELAERVRSFAASARSPATRRAYTRQWAAFVAWCASSRLPSLPAAPATVALYASSLAGAGRKVATIEQAMAAITAAHGAARHPSPREDANLRAALRGIRRELRTAQREASPVLAQHLHLILAVLSTSTLQGLRDRALLLVGFSGAFRRSELVALELRDIAFTTDGLEVTLRRSKTDQEGAGRLVALSYSGNPSACPVRALRTWLSAAVITEGPLFRSVTRHGKVSARALSDKSVSDIVKRSVAAVGLDPKTFSGHSLRAGFVTEAKLKRKDEAAIMRQTGHRSVAMVRKYDRRVDLWRDNASAGLLD
jgi:integrase